MALPVAMAREALGLRRITTPCAIDLLALADDLRLFVRRAAIGNAEGRLVRSGRQGVVTIDLAAFLSEKWRFVLAHEIGHFLLHEHRYDLMCFPKAGASRADKSRTYLDEQGASDFAVELLMPRAMIDALRLAGVPLPVCVRILAETFGVSLPTAALRALELTEEPCAIAYSEAGRVAWCTATRAFGVDVAKGTRVPGVSGAREAYADGQVVAARAWGRATTGVNELRAHAMPIPGFDAVVTVLRHEGAAAAHEAHPQPVT
jgi:hypothetical protein